MSAPTVAVSVVKKVPFKAVVPVVAARTPPIPAGSTRRVTVAPGTGSAPASITLTVTPLIPPGSRTARERSTNTVSRWGITRTVTAAAALPAPYPGFETSACTVTSTVCGTMGAVNVERNRPDASDRPTEGEKEPPVRTTSASFTGRESRSTTVTITWVVLPEATAFVNPTETLMGPFWITWSPAKDQKFSIPPGALTQPSKRSRLYT